MARLSTDVYAMSNVNPSSAQQLARCLRLATAVFGQIDIGPAGKAVLEIPLAFAMTQQHQFVHRLTHRIVHQPIL